MVRGDCMLTRPWNSAAGQAMGLGRWAARCSRGVGVVGVVRGGVEDVRKWLQDGGDMSEIGGKKGEVK